jgi:hypothetical protein
MRFFYQRHLDAAWPASKPRRMPTAFQPEKRGSPFPRRFPIVF